MSRVSSYMFRWIGRAYEACVFWGFAFSSEEQACTSRAGGIVAGIIPEEQLENVLPRVLCAFSLQLLL